MKNTEENQTNTDQDDMPQANVAPTVARHLNSTQRKALRRLGRGQSLTDKQYRAAYSLCLCDPEPSSYSEVSKWADRETKMINSKPQITDFGFAVLKELRNLENDQQQ